ncbi:hypothetical protein GGI07_003284 [Coemansia sp. Benny D115]|nr:hypothetical protein GGI07_003284 [Coemansia sp. Benny D115]
MSELEAQTAKLSVNEAAAPAAAAPAPAKPAKAKKAKGGDATPQVDRPEFIEHRNRIFDELFQKQKEEIARKYPPCYACRELTAVLYIAPPVLVCVTG